MRIDPRFAVPAALATLALAVPAGTAVADPPEENMFCPNATDWLLVPTEISPDPTKDRNEDGLVCQKINPEQADKDNNNPPDEFVDNSFPYLP